MGRPFHFIAKAFHKIHSQPNLNLNQKRITLLPLNEIEVCLYMIKIKVKDKMNIRNVDH